MMRLMMSVLEVIAIQKWPNKTYQDSCAGQAECSLPQTACAKINQLCKQHGNAVVVRSNLLFSPWTNLLCKLHKVFQLHISRRGFAPQLPAQGMKYESTLQTA